MMKSLDRFIEEIDADETIGNDDEIAALYEQIRLRDEAIIDLHGALEEHYQDSGPDSLTRIVFNEYADFVNEIGSDDR